MYVYKMMPVSEENVGLRVIECSSSPIDRAVVETRRSGFFF